MCTIVRPNYRILTAKKDIKVYKMVLDPSGLNDASFIKEVKTVHRRFSYIINKLYETEIEETNYTTSFDHIDIICATKKFSESELIYIGQGFHSIKLLHRVPRLRQSQTVVRCIIPKGSKYINGFSDIIVSNQIILKEILDRSYCNKIITKGKYYNNRY